MRLALSVRPLALMAAVVALAALLACPHPHGGASCEKATDCPAGEGCAAGSCAVPADGGAPAPDAGADCGQVQCAPEEKCSAGQCWPRLCAEVACRDSEICLDGACVAASCVGVVCSAGTYCANGACVTEQCGASPCAAGTVCQNGTCVEALCAGVICPASQVCAGGLCYTPSCSAQACATGEVCVEGVCTDARCAGAHCPTGKKCAAGRCDACATAETNCGDGIDDNCDGKTDCADPGCLGQDCSSACLQGGKCAADGTCQGGTKLADGTACGAAGATCVGGVCTSGCVELAPCGTGLVCHAGACVAGCAIAGTFYAGGAVNSANACVTCQPPASTSEWSKLADGTSCNPGMICYSGTCSPGCLIAGTFYAADAYNTAAACQQCQPAASFTAWTSLSGDATTPTCPFASGSCTATGCVNGQCHGITAGASCTRTVGQCGACGGTCSSSGACSAKCCSNSGGKGGTTTYYCC